DTAAHRRADRRGHEGQHLPMRNLRTHSRRHQGSLRPGGEQSMNTTPNVSRRDFLKVSALAGGGMLVALRFGAVDEALAADAVAPNAWITLRPDGRVVFTCHRNEMGQDVHTSLAMLL